MKDWGRKDEKEDPVRISCFDCMGNSFNLLKENLRVMKYEINFVKLSIKISSN